MIRALLDEHGSVEVTHLRHGTPIPDGWTATGTPVATCHHHHYSQPIVRLPMKAGEIASAAAGLVDGARHETHGDKRVNFENIARLWNAYLRCRFNIGAPTLLPHDVAQLMSLLKKARSITGLHNADDFVDDCGYSAIAGELSEGGQ